MGPVLVVSRFRESMLSMQDPIARHQRALRRARAGVGRRVIAASGLSAAAAVLLPYGGLGLPDVGWTAAAAASVAAAVLSGRRLRQLERQELPVSMPRRSSAARPPAARLGRAAGALTALLARLGPTATGTATEAAGAERSLRELAARVDAVEAALTLAPAEARAGLCEARTLLLGRLDEGTQAYERLVAAAAECVAASAVGPGDAFARRRLEEATEGLRGLAAGLYEAYGISRAVGC